MNELTDAQWAEPCLKHNREKEVEWSGLGYSFAWIDPEPVWCTAADWSMLFDKNYELAFPDPATPCTRILRFSLLGGGQTRSTERFQAVPPDWSTAPGVWRQKIELKVTAHTDGGITMAVGEKYQGPYYEMNAQAVVLRGNRQDIADRAAATFRLIDNDADNFFRVWTGSPGALSADGATRRRFPPKLELGLGPQCSRSTVFPHNKEAAERRFGALLTPAPFMRRHQPSMENCQSRTTSPRLSKATGFDCEVPMALVPEYCGA